MNLPIPRTPIFRLRYVAIAIAIAPHDLSVDRRRKRDPGRSNRGISIRVRLHGLRPLHRRNEILRKPSPSDHITPWGHAVPVTGYDQHRRVFRVRNPWRPAANDGGYFDMDHDYVLNPASPPISGWSTRRWASWALDAAVIERSSDAQRIVLRHEGPEPNSSGLANSWQGAGCSPQQSTDIRPACSTCRIWREQRSHVPPSFAKGSVESWSGGSASFGWGTLILVPSTAATAALRRVSVAASQR